MAPPDKAQQKIPANKKRGGAPKGRGGVAKKGGRKAAADGKKSAAPKGPRNALLLVSAVRYVKRHVTYLVGFRTSDAGPDYGPPLRKQGIFEKDLHLMMFGYGDVQPPLRETVSLVEEIVIDYSSALLQKASDQALLRGTKMQPEDILFVVRKDPMKFARAKELLSLNEEIKAARKGFEEQDTAFMDE